MIEEWKTIENFPDYEISNQGRVKSFKRYKEGKILKPGKDNHGYLKVVLYVDGKPYYKRIHRLVLENFKPVENMSELQCNHEDGNKENNIFLDNIDWCTPSDNIKHAVEIGLIKSGEKSPNYGKKCPEQSERMKGENHPRSILKEKNVIEIRKDLNEGILTQREIAKKFGVC